MLPKLNQKPVSGLAGIRGGDVKARQTDTHTHTHTHTRTHKHTLTPTHIHKNTHTFKHTTYFSMCVHAAVSVIEYVATNNANAWSLGKERQQNSESLMAEVATG